MKTTIIFLCFLGVCHARVTTETLNITMPSPTQAETSLTPSPSLTTHSAHHTPGSQTDQPKLGCPACSPATTPAYIKLFSVNHLLLIAGGLTLACTILLISTLLLAWKVCQLSRRLKMLSGHSDEKIAAKLWMGKNKSNTDAKETTVLMSNLNQTRDEDGDGGNGPETESKKEGKDVCENGVEEREKGAKNEEVKETPAAATEDSASPKEEGEKSPVDKSESTPTSEEAKDGE